MPPAPRRLALFLVVSLATLAGPAAAMPLHPDVEAKLAREGRLGVLRTEMADLRRQGLDRPAARAAPVLAAGDTGGMHIAVLLVDFPDFTWPVAVTNGSTYVSDHYRTILFSLAPTYFPGSMRDYYRENSYDRFDLTGQVSGWHQLPRNSAYYVAGRRGTGRYPNNAQALVEDAVRLADANDPGLDWSVFDNDGPDRVPSSGDDDGMVDGLIVVHAGPGYELTSNDNDIHSHFWNVVDLDLVVDGVRVFQYATCPEDGRIGVFSHEFGHNLGLPDLYDTVVPPGQPASSVVGWWSIMSYGAWLPEGANAGTRPSHFDAWSKVFLGFATAANLTDNIAGRQLRPIEDEPDMLRLWTNGRDSPQYFLVEHRAPRGFDAALPFASTQIGGLLIWHVDEELATNDDVGHPRVALEQADGRRDIEQVPGNYGDRGDYYTLGNTFTFASNPSSADYAGADTQVRVGGISAGAVFTADFTVESAPAVRKIGLRLVGEEGNGDGGLDATERAQAEIEIENIGLTASNLSVALESADPRIAVSGSPIEVGTLAEHATLVLPGTFSITVGALPSDPYPVDLTLRYSGQSYAAAEPVLLVAGDIIGFQSDVEEGEEGFRHSAGRPGFVDDWHVATGMARSGTQSWRCAVPGEGTKYRDLNDARLDTPVFAINDTTRLVFWHTMEAEVDVGTRAWDGGLVELSLDGRPFQSIEPAEPDSGYPYRIIRQGSSSIAERGAFSGTVTPFQRVVFDLRGIVGAGQTGAARVRFRFGSDGSIRHGGWVIDDITIASPTEPYGVLFLTPAVGASGEVIVSFAVDEFFPGPEPPVLPYVGRGFNVYRRELSPGFPLRAASGGAIPAGFEILNPSPLAPGATLTDTDVSPAEIYAYLLEDLREDGQEPRLYGPRRVLVPSDAPAPGLVRSNPNPFRPADGAAVVQFLVPAGEGSEVTSDVPVRLSIYDLQGHLVQKLVDGPRPPGKNEARWDGRTVRGFAPSGVYFLRLEAEGRTHGMRFVLIR